jgi:hypothetical protein
MHQLRLINEWWKLVLINILNILFNHSWYGLHNSGSGGKICQDILAKKSLA